MQLKVPVLASLLAVATAQDIASEVAMLPSCSLSCLTSAISAAGCGISDYACQCGDKKNDITKDATPCIAKACSTSDTLSVQKITAEICVLEAAAPASTAAGSSSIVSSSLSSVASSASTSIASSVSSSASAASTKASSSSSKASSSSSKAAASSSGSATSSAATSSTNTAAGATSTAATAGNSGGRLQVGGVIIGLAGLVALAI